MPRCGVCGEFIWYSRQFCPSCQSFDIRWEASTGHGTVYSVRVIRRGAPAAFVGAGPYAVALVDLDEGPRLYTNVVGAPPDEVAIGQRVTVDFTVGDGVPRFRVVA